MNAAMTAAAPPQRTQGKRPPGAKREGAATECFWDSVCRRLEGNEQRPQAQSQEEDEPTQTIPGGEMLVWLPSVPLWTAEALPQGTPLPGEGGGAGTIQTAAPVLPMPLCEEGPVPAPSSGIPGGRELHTRPQITALAAKETPSMLAPEKTAVPSDGGTEEQIGVPHRETEPKVSVTTQGMAPEGTAVHFLVGDGEQGDTPVQRADLPRQISARVEQSLTEGLTEFEMELSPQHLGKLRVRLTLDGEMSRMEVSCFRGETQKLLLEQADQLAALISRHTGGKTEVHITREPEPPHQSPRGDDGGQSGQRQQENRRQSPERERRKSDLESEWFWQTLQGRVTNWKGE